MTSALRRAAWAAIAELRAESLRLDVLTSAADGASTVVEVGKSPDTRVLESLLAISKKLKKAREKVEDGSVEIKKFTEIWMMKISMLKSSLS